jgi:hypothetical protein
MCLCQRVVLRLFVLLKLADVQPVFVYRKADDAPVMPSGAESTLSYPGTHLGDMALYRRRQDVYSGIDEEGMRWLLFDGHDPMLVHLTTRRYLK